MISYGPSRVPADKVIRTAEAGASRRFYTWLLATFSALALAAYGALGGGTRRFVACSKAYAISISRPSVHGMLVKLTPYGAGSALNPGGNAGFVGAFGI